MVFRVFFTLSNPWLYVYLGVTQKLKSFDKVRETGMGLVLFGVIDWIWDVGQFQNLIFGGGVFFWLNLRYGCRCWRGILDSVVNCGRNRRKMRRRAAEYRRPVRRKFSHWIWALLGLFSIAGLVLFVLHHNQHEDRVENTALVRILLSIDPFLCCYAMSFIFFASLWLMDLILRIPFWFCSLYVIWIGFWLLVLWLRWTVQLIGFDMI